MHELGIASSVLEAVQAEVDRHPGAVPVKVAVRVGELAGVDPGALAFSFEVLTNGTPWQTLRLEIETKPREHLCGACGATFRVVEYNFACPACGSLRSNSVSGDELELLYLELEEP